MQKYVHLLLLVVVVSGQNFQNVHVSIAQVLDGYSKEFDALLVPLGNQLVLWICSPTNPHKILGISENDNYFLPILSNAIVLDYQKFVEEMQINDDEQLSILISARREASKGTTIKITFNDSGDKSSIQEELIQILETSLEKQIVITHNLEQLLKEASQQLQNQCKKSDDL